jgi:hypothetical protein
LLAGRPDEALDLLAEALEALEAVERTGERHFEAELYRLKGECLLARAAAAHGEAEVCFRRAIDIARRQQAKALELRAVMSVTRLCVKQSETEQGRQMLGAIRRWSPPAEAAPPATPPDSDKLPTGFLKAGRLFDPLIADPRWPHFGASYQRYTGFTEGFATADLVEAGALLA